MTEAINKNVLTKFTKVLHLFSDPENSFLYLKEMSKYILYETEDDDKATKVEAKKEEDIYPEIDNTKFATIFAVFARTQLICHHLLQNGFDLKSITKLKLPPILPSKIEEDNYYSFVQNETSNNYGIENFFDTIIKSINQKDDKNKTEGNKDIIRSIYQKLYHNTTNFFKFMDENAGSINQYLKNVNEKYCKNESLIKLKTLFNSFNNLREPADRLIQLYYNKMVTNEIVDPKDVNFTCETHFKYKESDKFQTQLLQDYIEYLYANLNEEEEEEEEVKDKKETVKKKKEAVENKKETVKKKKEAAEDKKEVKKKKEAAEDKKETVKKKKEAVKVKKEAVEEEEEFEEEEEEEEEEFEEEEEEEEEEAVEDD